MKVYLKIGNRVLIDVGGLRPKPVENPDLCFSCVHRRDSMAQVDKHRARGGRGMVLDPAPRRECKEHAGYGRAPKSLKTCIDFCSIENGE